MANLRHGLNGDLGFSAQDRAENIRRTGEVAALITSAGVVTLILVIAPYRADRDRVRSIHDDAGRWFFEVFVDTPLKVCRERDPKGLYAKADAGELTGLTGVDAPYEAPYHPDLLIDASCRDVSSAAQLVLDLIRNHGG